MEAELASNAAYKVTLFLTFSLSRAGKWKAHLGITNSQSRRMERAVQLEEMVTVRFPRPLGACCDGKFTGRSIYSPCQFMLPWTLSYVPRGFISAAIILAAALQPICGYRMYRSPCASGTESLTPSPHDQELCEL